MTYAVPGPRGPGGVAHKPNREGAADLYELLEVSPHARPAVIQAAYRALVRDCHPDVNDSPEAAHRARQLNAAYDVLSNPEYRARYDLDRTRLRRSESLRYAATAPSPTRSVGSSLATRHAAATREQRVSRITGQVVLALIVAVLVATMLFFLVLMALDSTADDMPTRSGQPPSQLVQR